MFKSGIQIHPISVVAPYGINTPNCGSALPKAEKTDAAGSQTLLQSTTKGVDVELVASLAGTSIWIERGHCLSPVMSCAFLVSKRRYIFSHILFFICWYSSLAFSCRKPFFNAILGRAGSLFRLWCSRKPGLMSREHRF